MKWFIISLYLLFFDQLMAMPVDQERHYSSAHPDERSGFYEGDILFRTIPNRIVSTDPGLRWPLPIPYYIDPVLKDHTTSIQSAINEFQRNSCVRFTQLNETNRPNWPQDYLHFNITQGCSSYVGRQGGAQNISLEIAAGCIFKGVIMHEISHALGFWHEHNRPDRDQYVLILLNNTIPSMVNNFDKYNSTNVDFFGEAYDFSSIMHGSGYFLSINDTVLRTMVAKNDSTLNFGQRFFLSESDIRRLNMYYGCTTTTTRSTTITSTTRSSTTTTPTTTTPTTTLTPTTTSSTTIHSTSASTIPIPVYGICNETTEFLPFPGNCHKYYRCNGLLAYEMTCPHGLYFNADLNVCDWPYHVKCPYDSGPIVVPRIARKSVKKPLN